MANYYKVFCPLCGKSHPNKPVCPLVGQTHAPPQRNPKPMSNCYKCGQDGHMAKDCFSCYNCGQTGHTAKDCPKKSIRDEAADKWRWDENLEKWCVYSRWYGEWHVWRGNEKDGKDGKGAKGSNVGNAGTAKDNGSKCQKAGKAAEGGRAKDDDAKSVRTVRAISAPEKWPMASVSKASPRLSEDDDDVKSVGSSVTTNTSMSAPLKWPKAPVSKASTTPVEVHAPVPDASPPALPVETPAMPAMQASQDHVMEDDAVSLPEVSTRVQEPTLKDMVATIREQLGIEDSFTTQAQIIAEANRQLDMEAKGNVLQQAKSLYSQLTEPW